MRYFTLKTKRRLFFKFSTWTVLFSFLGSLIGPAPGNAQESFFLPNPGTMVVASPSFIPPVMKGIKIFPDNPLRFDFVIDTGHADLTQEALKTESTKLIKYFLATLTVPEDDLWVNLSPYEKDRIIPDKFGVTEMGRDLLAQDYVLKQLTASLIYPEEELGKKFWDKIYAKVNQLYGTTHVPVNTFNKVWIVPDKAVVYESGDTAFIVASHLKVMLEGDYLALKENLGNQEIGADQLNKEDVQQLSEVSSAIIKEIILPEIEKEVNTGENFTSLRQVYNSMILATWFKRNLKESLLGRVYVGENKIAGVDVDDKKVKEKIYQQYLEAFKMGVYNYIKEDYDPATQDVIPRKYFSGGVEFRAEAVDNAMVVEQRPLLETVAEVSQAIDGQLQTVSAVLDPVKNLDRLRRLLKMAPKAMSGSKVIRLYRVYNPDGPSLTIPGQEGLVGQWFSSDIDYVLNYVEKNFVSTQLASHDYSGLRLAYVDLPVAEAYQYLVTPQRVKDEQLDAEKDNFTIPVNTGNVKEVVIGDFIGRRENPFRTKFGNPAQAKENKNTLRTQIESLEIIESKASFSDVLNYGREIPQDASEDVILESVLSYLEASGLIKEIRNEPDGVKIFVIKDEVKETELGRAIQEWVMEPRGGVRAINFKGTDGIWKIVGFESDMTPLQLNKERREVYKRKKEGKHYLVAFLETEYEFEGKQPPSQEEVQAFQESARQKYEVARRDIIGPSIRRVPVSDKKKVGKVIPGIPLRSQKEYNRDTNIKEKFLKGKDVTDRFIAPGREGFQQFQPIYNEVRSIIDRLMIAEGLNPTEFQFFLADTVEPNAYIVRHYNTIVVHLGLIQMLAEYARANNIEVTQDALAWVLAHEIQHFMQNRRAIDDGRIDEEKSLVDSHAEGRGKEYQSDLLALWLMDRGGFNVKMATHFFAGINHWLKTRGEKSAVWGTHPQIEERLRRLERHIKTYHWQNQDAQATLLNSASDSYKRTNFRLFQEKVINVTTAAELVLLLNQATSIDELLFAMLIGFEVLPDVEKQSPSRIQVTFEQQTSMLAGEDEAKKVLFDYMKNEVYVMLELIREPNLDTFKLLGEQLSVETILRIYELGVPNLFSLSIDVDKLQKKKRHRQAEDILQRLNTVVISLSGQTRPSDRFRMYTGGFLYGLYTRMIRDTRQEKLTLEQARRFLTDLVEMQNSQGYFKGYLFTSPLSDMTSALTSSTIYRGQLEAEDIKLLIRVYEILGTKVNYAMKADGLAKNLYELARNTTPAAKNEIMDWLVRRDDGWNSLRAEFIKLDIQTLFKEGQGIVFQGSRTEYLDSLLANKNIVKNMQNVLKVFVEATQARDNNISSEELVIVHQKIFTKFREEHINNDFGIFRDLWLRTRRNSPMFAGDAFERVLLENTSTELRPLIERTRRELRPILYVIALGGIPEEKDLRDFIFGALHVRERPGNMLDDSEIVALLMNATPERTIYDEKDLSERYNAVSNKDRNGMHDRWNQINPEKRIENVNNDEFMLIRKFLEHSRRSMGVLLSEKDATSEQQEEAFGKYAAPIYLQALFIQIGYDVRLNENDVGYGSGAWDLFSGDIARKGVTEEDEVAERASKQRPMNAVRFLSEKITFENFVRLFDFISLLSQSYEIAVSKVVKEMPPSVFRNFVLHMVFVNRILKETGYVTDNNSLFDLRKMQSHIAGLTSDQRAKVLHAIAAITPHLVHDEIMETSNRKSIRNYWIERYFSNAVLDERTIRQQHDQEIGRYEDMTHTNPGGPIAQLLIFVSRLADNEIENTLKDARLSLSSKREMIERYYPQSSTARDRWIKAAIENDGADKTVDEIEKLLVMIYSNELRDNLALNAFDRYRSEHPGDFESLNNVLEAIQRFFPEASLIRDDVLAETAQYLAKTREQYEEVRKLYLDPFKKTKDLDLKETARTAMNQDIFRGWMTNRSPSEKAHFLLWLMGVTDEKPFFLVNFEYNFHVNANSLREDFGRRQSQYYPSAGQSSQREALEPFLYGEKGIFNEGTAMANLLNGMFDYLIKEGPNKSVLKKVFDKVFEKADQSRREEIFLSLVWTLSLQRGEISAQTNITPERQEARAVRMFLESLGLVGRQLAQVLARSLWVTPLMRDELSQVQDSARKMDKGVVFDMLEKFDLTGRFESIEEPLGSAKIAGVYRARMRDGRVVAIKVKRPEVDKTIEADMKFLKDVFDEDLRSTFMAEGIVIPDNFIVQIEEGFRQELDFEQEARNTAELGSRVHRTVLKRIKEFSLKKLFGDTRLGEVRGDYEFYVPQIIEVFNNSAIVMEYIEGTKLSSEARVREAGVDQKDVELAVANELLREIFYEGFYHGDPHLGNILIQKGENGRVRIVLIDAGASFRLNKNNRRLLGKLMVAVRDSQKAILESIVQELGGALNEDIRSELTTEVLQSRNSVGQKLLWFFHILEKNHIAMPNELLNIMRFFATGQALFNYGESASTNETSPTGPMSGTTEDSAILAEELDSAINRVQDGQTEAARIQADEDSAMLGKSKDVDGIDPKSTKGIGGAAQTKTDKAQVSTPVQKNADRLQAQVEIFADRGVKEFSKTQKLLLTYSAELAKIKDLDNLPPNLPEELVTLIKENREAYIDFLRREKRLETAFIEENIKNYRGKFQSVIAELKTRIAQGDFKKLPEYLGSGANGSAFMITVDGRQYAAKFSNSIVQANFELKPLLRAKGLPHVAQLVSYSFEDKVVIMELLPGTDVTNFTPEGAPDYSDEHIVQLIETVKTLDENGIKIDPKPSNFMYDPEQGFSVLDFHLKEGGNSRYGLPQAIMSLISALTARKFDQLDYSAPDYKEKVKVRIIEEHRILLPMLVRFLKILKERYPDILASWERQHKEDMENPRIRTSDLVSREFMPKLSDLEPYVKILEGLGITGVIAPEQDSAMASEDKESEVGGIDLNPNILDLQTQGSGINFDIPFDPQLIESIQIDGFSPVILQIVPANLPLLIGGAKTNQSEQQLSSVR